MKNSIWRKVFAYTFNKADGYIIKYDGTEYLASFHPNETNETIFDRIRYLILLKSNILGAFYQQER